LAEKHATRKRRSWRKLHIGMDAGTGRIVAAVLTDKDADDGAQVGSWLDWTSPLGVEGLLTNLSTPGGRDGGEADPTKLHEGV
jgi:hypothetical protein